MTRLLFVPLLGLLLPALAWAALVKHNVHSPHWTDDYDGHFRKYSKRYFGPGFDWRWFKAQGIAESGLRPKAKSWVGARGIMQIMPATFQEIRDANPHFSSITDPRWNIAAGIYYDRQLYKRWRKHVDAGEERLAFSFGSYNAGYGNVLKAYRRAGGGDAVRGWADIERYAPTETRNYVKRIKGPMGPQ